jgi:hypothetical protein
MTKETRKAKIAKLQEKLGSKVICFLTSDRPNVTAHIARDCSKIVQNHLGATEHHAKLSLFIVSHGGDLDVPWELVTLLRSHCKKLQAVVPYVCHSAATMIALGCDELVVGPRGQLSPTDPTLQVKTGPDEKAPVMQFGVEDINAFLSFVREELGSGYSRHGHEALNRLIDRVQPELLGNINRTYFRIRLLIEKLLSLTGRRYTPGAMKRVIDQLTVAYYSHQHFISREEMISDLKLPVVRAEQLGLDPLIWELYEEYQSEFQSRSPFDMQAEANKATANPLTVEIKGRFVESIERTDCYVQTILIAKTGLPTFNFTLPQVTGIPQQAVQQVIQHFMGELNNQLQPFMVAKKLSSFGEWRTE